MDPIARIQIPADVTHDEILALAVKLSADPDLGEIADDAEWEEALSKAVAAHHSHVQQRQGRTGRFVPYNPRREQPRGTSGRFVKRLTGEERVEAERLSGVVIDRFDTVMGRHLGDLEAGRLDAAEAAKRGRESIAEYYEQIFRRGMQAAGNPAILLTPRDRSALSRIVRDEGDFWQSFMRDVAAGTGKIPYPERQGMYTNAAREAFWLGWVLGDLRPRRRIRWVMGPTEHCDTCLAMAARGPMSPFLFLQEALAKGFLPQSGYLDCKGIHCQCKLVEVGDGKV